MLYVFVNGDGEIVSSHNYDTVLELPRGAIKISAEFWPDRLCHAYQGGEWIKQENKEDVAVNG